MAQYPVGQRSIRASQMPLAPLFAGTVAVKRLNRITATGPTLGELRQLTNTGTSQHSYRPSRYRDLPISIQTGTLPMPI